MWGAVTADPLSGTDCVPAEVEISAVAVSVPGMSGRNFTLTMQLPRLGRTPPARQPLTRKLLSLPNSVGLVPPKLSPLYVKTAGDTGCESGEDVRAGLAIHRRRHRHAQYIREQGGGDVEDIDWSARSVRPPVG